MNTGNGGRNAPRAIEDRTSLWNAVAALNGGGDAELNAPAVLTAAFGPVCQGWGWDTEAVADDAGNWVATLSPWYADPATGERHDGVMVVGYGATPVLACASAAESWCGALGWAGQRDLRPLAVAGGADRDPPGGEADGLHVLPLLVDADLRPIAPDAPQPELELQAATEWLGTATHTEIDGLLARNWGRLGGVYRGLGPTARWGVLELLRAADARLGELEAAAGDAGGGGGEEWPP
jgi:hypothetical protein